MNADQHGFSANGHQPHDQAPHPGGAFAVRGNGAGLPAPAPVTPPAAAARTVFLPEVRPATLRLVLYALGRAELAGTRLWRWVWAAGLLLALIWLPGWLPGGYWVSAALVLALIGLALLRVRLGRTDFVTFAEQPLPPVAPAPLPAAAKLPVYAAGRLGVEAKERRFTWLPGFYRTFATREHALLCHCTPRRVLGIGAWPEDEAGLWYAFFKPEDVRQVRWGTADVGGVPRRTLAVTVEAPPAGNAGKRRGGPETFYIACIEEAQAAAILGDLLHDARVPAGVP
jgi:hypothetical protein